MVDSVLAIHFINYYNTIGKEVESGKIEIRLHDGVIPYTQIEDLCQVVQKEGKSCPLKPGKQSISLSTPIPSIAPKVIRN